MIPSHRRLKTVGPHLLALGCLVLVAILYAWPLLSALTTAIPGRSDFKDVTEYVWNTWWVRHALTSDAPLFYTADLFVPFGADLRLNTFGLLPGLLAFPFTTWLGVVGTYNLILIFTLFLNGAVTYALFYYQTRHTAAALIAAAWLMLASTLLGQLNVGRSALGSLWIVTGSLLAIATLLAQPRLWKGIILGLVLTAARFTDFQILLFTALWLALYCGYWFWWRREFRAVLLPLLVAVAIILVPFLLVYYPILTGAEAAGYPRPGYSSMMVYSFSLKHYFMPSLWWIAAGGYELVATAAAAIILFRGRGPYRFWLAGAAFFLVLALGPYLQPTRIPLPFAAFSLWSPLGQFRTPARLNIPATIGLAMVAAIVLSHLLTRVRTRRLLILIILAAIGGRLLFAQARNPFVVQTYPDYATYRQIAAEPGEFTLLEVPFGIRSGLEQIGSGGEVVQYYQPLHGKRLINGSMARLPTQVFDFYRTHPALMFLSGEPLEVSDSVLDSDFSAVLQWSAARYVLVHRAMLDPPLAERIIGFLDRQPTLHRFNVEQDLVVYQVSPAH